MINRECGVFYSTYAADMRLFPLPLAGWTTVGMAVLFFGLFPLAANDYFLNIANFVLIAVVGAVGLNLLVGYTGQVSIGQGAFMAVGAYAGAMAVTRAGMPFWIALPLLLAFSAGLAGVLVLIGILVVKFRNVLGNRWGEGRFVRALPIVSALFITLMGFWFCYEAVHVAEEEEGSSSMFTFFVTSNLGFVFLLAIAAGFGAVHALTPGHGKTMVAAYLVGEQGTPRHAVILGLIVTLTHTSSAFAVAMLLRFVLPASAAPTVQTVLGIGGGALVGDYLQWQEIQNQQQIQRNQSDIERQRVEANRLRNQQQSEY